MSVPRRSARLAPHANTSIEQQRQQQHSHARTSAPTSSLPHLSQPSSTSTSSYPSPLNNGDMSNPPASHSQPRLQIQSSFMPQRHSSHLDAPLPSPSTNDFDPFFGRPHSQPSHYSSHPSQQTQQQAQAGVMQQAPAYSQGHPHHTSFSQPGGTPGQPGAMPQNFLAEAAKRAQMACLMRDLGDVTL